LKIVITDETVLYDGRDTYPLTKGPVKTITAIKGIVKGFQYAFRKGKDFDADKQRNSVVWLTGGLRPEENTPFSVDYVVYTEIADTIVERLPMFYLARERNSALYELASGFANIVHDQERDVSRLRDSRSINSAYGRDLDLLASTVALGRKRDETDEDFRSRIKSTVLGIRIGGTIEAIRTQLASFLGASTNDFTIVENPPTELQLAKNALSGDTWPMSSRSISDERAMITISPEGGEAHDPALIDTEANTTIRFTGTLKKGDKLEIVNGKARLNGVDATGSIHFGLGGAEVKPTEDLPSISRKESKWEFRERLSDALARFDKSKFDENVFFKDIPPTNISMKWTAKLLATFEVMIPAKIMERNANLSKSDIEAFVNALKAAGVRAFVKIMPDSSQLDTPRVRTDTTKEHPSIKGRMGS